MQYRNYLHSAAALIARSADTLPETRVENAIVMICNSLRSNRPLLVCGNGGSAADAMHIAGELVGKFLVERKPYKVMALPTNEAFLTAWSNDYSYDGVFARQVEAYGEPGGVLWGISTSGNSKNVITALGRARELGLHTIGLTGEGGGAMAPLCDVLLDVSSRSTPEIQQVHLCLYHFICARVEEELSRTSN